MKHGLAFVFALLGIVACGASSPDGPAEGAPAAGCTGSACADAGRFEEVHAVDAGPGTCGDDRCHEATESCRTCAVDCGECAKCVSAPSCSDAVGVPSSPTVRADLSQTDVDAGAPAPLSPTSSECLDPQLRLRIERVVTHKGGGEVYCVVSANDGASGEVAITTKTRGLGEGESNFFDPANATFWGQKSLHPTTNNLTITYNCFAVKGDGWSRALKAMGDRAGQLGGTAGPYGWVFGAGSVAADAAAAAIDAASGDELRMNAQQVVDKGGLVDLTNGRYWSVRKKKDGGLFGGGWDWEIFIQSWGCADARSVAK